MEKYFGKLASSVVWAWLLCSALWAPAEAGCTKPAEVDKGYSLTSDLTDYTVGSTYEFYCIPGYTLVGASNLTCQASDTWSDVEPTCTNAAGEYPWWLLLCMLLAVILVVPCCVPRIFYCIFQERNKTKADPDDPESDFRPATPVNELSKNQVSTMEVMEDVYGDEVDMEQLKRAAGNCNF